MCATVLVVSCLLCFGCTSSQTTAADNNDGCREKKECDVLEGMQEALEGTQLVEKQKRDSAAHSLTGGIDSAAQASAMQCAGVCTEGVGLLRQCVCSLHPLRS